MKTLYKLAKTGKIQVYTAWAEDGSVCSKSGQLDGAMTPSSFKCTGKNIGKSNETSPNLQAMIEWRAKIQSKRDKGYFDTIEEAQNTIVFLPMLAAPYEKRASKIVYPCDVQPKLDGVRCMATKEGLMSRGGKPYDVKHISDIILGDDVRIPDGELYIHGMLLQDLVSLVKKPKPGSEEIEYWIYDMYFPEESGMTWEQRGLLLDFNSSNLEPKIKYVPRYRVNNEAEMKAYHDRFVEEGYEGLIIRELHGTYELGHRSRHLIKYKAFEDAEYKIIAFKQGKGKFERCVIWRCITPEGEEFDVTPKGTLKQKKEWYLNAGAQIGKDLTVRFWNKSSKGIPAPAVGIVIRDYE